MDKYIHIAHHGIKGQKWGVRRYQNSDGTLTVEGKRRKDTYARPLSDKNPYTERQTARIHRKREKLDAAVEKQANKPGFISNARTNAAARSYVDATGHPYTKHSTAVTTVGTLLGGPIGGILAGSVYSLTPIGDSEARDYTKSVADAVYAAQVNYAAETKIGRDAILSAMPQEMRDRPDRY